jgi:multidrug efflux pump
MRLVETAIANARLTISVLLFLMLAGTMAYVSIPKEAEPDIQIPILYVSMHYDGISPEDSERLLLRPMETAIKSITGIKKMTSTAYQNGGNVLIEFQAGADLKKALDDVRNKVDMARPELPDGADEPTVNEVNLSEFPILVITLSGNVPERVLATAGPRAARPDRGTAPGPERRTAGRTRRSGRGGDRPRQAGHLRIAARHPDRRASPPATSWLPPVRWKAPMGRYAIKVPSLLETIEDVANLPVVSTGTATVRVRDIADILPTMKDPETITRLDGQPAIAIEVSKRTGANLIETVDQVKAVTEVQEVFARRHRGQLQPGQVEGHPPACCSTCRTRS